MATQLTAHADGFLTAGSVYVMSNGDIVALFRRSGAGYYAVSQDGGTTWSATLAVPGWTTIPKWFLDATQNGDSVVLLTSPSFAAFLSGTVSGAPLALSTLAYNTATHQFGSPTTVNVTPPGAPANTIVQFATLLWHVSDTSYYIAYASNINSGAQTDIRILKCGTSGTVTQLLATGWSYTTFYGFSTAVISGTTLAVLAGDSSRISAVLFPVSISGAMTLAAVETVSAIPFDDAPQTVLLPDGSGHIDFVTQGQHTGHVYTFRRTAANTYSSVTTLAVVDVSPRVPSAAFDAASTDATVFYAHATSSTVAQTFAIRRLAGMWQPASQVDTLSQTAANPTASASRGVLAMAGSFSITAPGVIDYIGALTASAPNAPTNMSPNGLASGLTPTLSSTYTNVSAGDPQKSLQDIVTRDSDAVVMWDSGEVVTAASSEVYAGTALTLNVAYTWKRRYKDSLTAAGAGTWGPYASAPLIPAHLPVATITGVTFGSTTASSSPFMLTNDSLSVAFTYTQSDGDAGDQYQVAIYDATGAVQELGPVVSAAMANGATVTTPAHVFSTLLNTTGYTIGVLVRDGVTGRQGTGPLWTFTTAWPPPGPVTSLTATPNSQEGYVTLAWTNPTGLLSGVLIESSTDGGATWRTEWGLPGAPVISTRNVYPNVGIPTNYRVSTWNAIGASATVTVTNVILPPHGVPGQRRLWLVSVDNPTLKVALGPYTNASNANVWGRVEEAIELIPAGQKDSDWAYSVHEQYVAANEVWSFYAYNREDGVRVQPYDEVMKFDQMRDSEDLLLWRDHKGKQRYCRIFAGIPTQTSANVWTYSFSLKTVAPPLLPLTS